MNMIKNASFFVVYKVRIAELSRNQSEWIYLQKLFKIYNYH